MRGGTHFGVVVDGTVAVAALGMSALSLWKSRKYVRWSIATDGYWVTLTNIGTADAVDVRVTFDPDMTHRTNAVPWERVGAGEPRVFDVRPDLATVQPVVTITVHARNAKPWAYDFLHPTERS